MKFFVPAHALLLAASAWTCASPTGTWRSDFKRQPVSARPRIEVRYSDASRTAFTIEAQDYSLTADLKSGSGQRITGLAVRGSKGFANVLGRSGAFLELVDAGGVRYSSLNSANASRINIYRRGPYYIEMHWLDVELVDAGGRAAPVKGEVVFYSYPEKTHVGVMLHVTGPIDVADAAMTIEFEAQSCASPSRRQTSDGTPISGFVLIKRAEGAPACALVYPVPRGIDDVALEKGEGIIRVTNSLYSADSHDGVPAVERRGKACRVFRNLPA
ncbi:MAG: hypothetical protein ACP5R5_01245 [Armatimonadota bacterium]